MEDKKKVYLAHPISTKGEFTDSIRVANRIRELGYEVYAAAENAAINDKSNDPTPMDIYDADVTELLSADIIVVNLTGGNMDGTVFELGGFAVSNHRVKEFLDFYNKIVEFLNHINVTLPPELDFPFKEAELIVYTSNARALQPQFHKGVASAHLNHLLLGGSDRQGEFVRSEDDMIEKLKRLLDK